MRAFYLPTLKFDPNQIKGLASAETIYYHYEKHHSGYIQKTNEMLGKPEFGYLRDRSLEEVCRVAENPLADQARQAWNHTFYWDGIASDTKAMQFTSAFQEMVEASFGKMEEFREQFKKDCMEIFGSGWLWLVFRDHDQKMGLIKAQGSEQPFWGNSKPLLVCDVWEHAYYIDFRNERKAYLEAFWSHINWSFVEQNLNSPLYSATARMSKNSKEESNGKTRNHERSA